MGLGKYSMRANTRGKVIELNNIQQNMVTKTDV